MNIDNIKKIVEQKKSGILNESKIPDYIKFTESCYDINEPIFMVHKSLTVDDTPKLAINESFIGDTSYEQLDTLLENEIQYHDSLFNVLMTTNQLHTCKSLDEFSKVIAYMSCGHKSDKVFGNMIRFTGKDSSDTEYDIFKEDWSDNVSKLKTLVVERIKRLNEYVSVQPTNMMLDEGMIKVPSKAVSIAKEIIDVCIYQLAIDSVYDHSVHELMKRFIDKLDIDSSIKKKQDFYIGDHIGYDRENGFSGSVDIRLESHDIPYDIEQEFIPMSIVISNDEDYTGLSDEINGVPFIVLNVGMLYNAFKTRDVLNNPLVFEDKSFIEKINAIRDDLMSTVIHELMHVMQHTVFAQNEYRSGNNNPKSIDKDGVGDDSYTTSQVEFDPMVNDTINTFTRQIKSVEGYIGSELSLSTKKELLKKYLGTEYGNGDLPSQFDDVETALYNAFEQVFRPNHFVKTIKDQLPKKYPILVKKVYQELEY